MASVAPRVLLVGDTSTGSYAYCFRRALADWGVETMVAETATLPATAWLRWPGVTYASRMAARVIAQTRNYTVSLAIRRACRTKDPFITLVVGMNFMAEEDLAHLKGRGVLVLFFNDDLETRRGRSPAWWANASRLLNSADLLVTQRPHRLEAIRRHYSGPVLFQDFAYMEMFHKPYDGEPRLSCDVGFVGNYDPDRIPFLQAITRRGLAMSVWGTLWPARTLRRERVSYQGYLPVERTPEALASSRIGLCLVRHNNFDLQVMRTFEVPACGAFLLAERTADHQRLFVEGTEAEFFDGTDELADKAGFYSTHESARQQIARAGLAKVIATPNRVCDRLSEALGHEVVREAVPGLPPRIRW